MWNTVSHVLYWLVPLLHHWLQQKHAGCKSVILAQWTNVCLIPLLLLNIKPCNHTWCVGSGLQSLLYLLVSRVVCGDMLLPGPGLNVSNHVLPANIGQCTSFQEMRCISVKDHILTSQRFSPCLLINRHLGPSLQKSNLHLRKQWKRFYPDLWLWLVASLILSNYISLG